MSASPEPQEPQEPQEPRGRPYADAVQVYLDLGWSSPIPLGPRAGMRACKAPIPKGYGGRDALVPGKTEIENWTATHAVNNIGLHLVDGQLGIDVDDYDDKHGGDTLAELEARLGPLPPCHRSTSRGADNPSGIRVFRVPAGLEFITKIKDGGIDFIQPKHRHVTAWPSMHELESRYEWYGLDKSLMTCPPRADELAELPTAWVEFLRADAVRDNAARYENAPSLERDEAVAWLTAHGGGEPCRAVRLVLRKELAELAEAVEFGASRYDAAVPGVWALVSLAVEGHTGVRASLKVLRDAYHEAVAGEKRRDPTEWSRQVQGAIEKAAVLAPADWTAHLAGECPAPVAAGGSSTWPSPRAPRAVAERAVAELWTIEAGVTLAYWRGDFYEHAGSHWRTVSEDAVKAVLSDLLREAEYVGGGKDFVMYPWNPDNAKLANVVGQLKAVVRRDERAEPAGSDRSEIVAFANGVLDVATRELRAHSPALFNLAALEFDFDPDAGVAENWLEFLSQLWPDGPDAIALLQEWLGYLVSGSMNEQKVLLLLGRRRSGKGTIGNVIAALIGREGSCGPILSSLAGTFGLQPLIGKSSAVIGDARYNARTGSEAIGKLLTIIGEDHISVPRKNIGEPWEGKLAVRFTFLSNEVPAYIDPSGAMAGRFLALQTLATFYGREDKTLFERKLKPEIPAILLWALEGLDRLREQGHFTEPESSREVTEAMHEDSSPIKAFLNECCVKVPLVAEGGIERTELFRAYRRWCEQEGRFALDKSRFGSDLRAVFPEAMGKGNAVWRVSEGVSKRVRVYYGIELRDEWIVGEL